MTKEQITFALPTMDVRNTVLADRCPLEVDFPCQPRKYRAYNGYCNNVQNPRWGNANTRYLRFLPPDYSDGIKTHYWRMESMEILNNCRVSVSCRCEHSPPGDGRNIPAERQGHFAGRPQGCGQSAPSSDGHGGHLGTTGAQRYLPHAANGR